MKSYETLHEMKELCYKYGIDFLIANHGIIVKKYFTYNGSPHSFNQVFPFFFLENHDLEDMVLEFEKRLELDMERLRMKEESEE